MAAKMKTKIALTTLSQEISVRKHHFTMAITTIGTESLWAFPESYTANDSWIVHFSTIIIRCSRMGMFQTMHTDQGYKCYTNWTITI